MTSFTGLSALRSIGGQLRVRYNPLLTDAGLEVFSALNHVGSLVVEGCNFSDLGAAHLVFVGNPLITTLHGSRLQHSYLLTRVDMREPQHSATFGR